jgi:hypothetical protein
MAIDLIAQGMADAWSLKRMGEWAVARLPNLRTAITLKRLEKSAYIRLFNYFKLARVGIEPPSSRLAWFILSLTNGLWC